MATLKLLWDKSATFRRGLTHSNLSWFAAACAFYMFFSLAPISILIASVLPMTSISQEALLAALLDYLPDTMGALINIIVEDVYTGNMAILSLSIVATIWTSAMAFSALMRGMEAIYEKPDYINYFRRRAMSMLYTLLFIFAMLLTLSISIVTQNLTESIIEQWPGTARFFDVLMSFKVLILISVLTLIFMLIYKSVPGVSVRFLHQLPGALGAAIVWLLFSKLFPFFIAWTSSYGTYGIIGTIFIALLWMYYSMYLVLLGSYLNKYLATLRKK